MTFEERKQLDPIGQPAFSPSNRPSLHDFLLSLNVLFWLNLLPSHRWSDPARSPVNRCVTCIRMILATLLLYLFWLMCIEGNHPVRLTIPVLNDTFTTSAEGVFYRGPSEVCHGCFSRLLQSLDVSALAGFSRSPGAGAGAAYCPHFVIRSRMTSQPVDFTQSTEAVKQPGLYWLALNEPPMGRQGSWANR